MAAKGGPFVHPVLAGPLHPGREGHQCPSKLPKSSPNSLVVADGQMCPEEPQGRAQQSHGEDLKVRSGHQTSLGTLCCCWTLVSITSHELPAHGAPTVGTKCQGGSQEVAGACTEGFEMALESHSLGEQKGNHSTEVATPHPVNKFEPEGCRAPGIPHLPSPGCSKLLASRKLSSELQNSFLRPASSWG